MARKNQKNNKNNKANTKNRIIAVYCAVALAIVLIPLSIGLYFAPVYYYNHGMKMIEQKEYYKAYKSFANSTYKDSAEKVQYAKYLRAQELADEGRYLNAYGLIEDLPNCEELEQRCIYALIDNSVNDDHGEETSTVVTEITLKPQHYETVYAKIKDYINSHNDLIYWEDNKVETTRNAEKAANLLSLLPDDYEKTGALKIVFNDLKTGNIYPIANYIDKYADNLNNLSEFGFIKSLLQNQ